MDGSQGYEPRVYYTPTMGYDAGSSGWKVCKGHVCRHTLRFQGARPAALDALVLIGLGRACS